jgi:uncharacterized protein YfaT (DUF1175 family)
MLKFHLPVVASRLVVKGDADAGRFVEHVSLVPLSSRGESSDMFAVRARDAARYGDLVVFTTDERVVLDAHGFWVLAGRQPEVVVYTEGTANALDLELRNVSVPNRVSLWAGRWSSSRTLGPDETWRVRVPVVGLGRPFRMGIKSQSGLPLSKGLLGCRVEIR